MEERIQKLIANSGAMSRRAAEKLISEGKVTVNGDPATLGMKAESRDDIRIDGKPISQAGGKVYILLNKPQGYVTTLSDEKNRKVVTDLVNIRTRVYPVGRLDMFSEGLLLLTNDGELTNRLMHPSSDIVKVYEVHVRGTDIRKRAAIMRQPIEIDGKMTSPADVQVSEVVGEDAVLYVSIHEGRNRQVRRLCEAAGLRCIRLIRIKEGPLELGNLKVGKWRTLTPEEIQCLMSL